MLVCVCVCTHCCKNDESRQRELSFARVTRIEREEGAEGLSMASRQRAAEANQLPK